jgi:hypothetical protein
MDSSVGQLTFWAYLEEDQFAVVTLGVAVAPLQLIRPLGQRGLNIQPLFLPRKIVTRWPRTANVYEWPYLGDFNED